MHSPCVCNFPVHTHRDIKLYHTTLLFTEPVVEGEKEESVLPYKRRRMAGRGDSIP